MPIKFSLVTTVLIISIFLSVSPAHAQPAWCQFVPSQEFCLFQDVRISGINDVINLLANLLYVFIAIIGILAVGVILFSAFLFLTAGDDESRRKRAKGWLTYGIIGIVVAILSFTIIALVTSVLTSGIF